MAVGQQRLDKYYNLAKEKGYRARSAFKLLELNRKFEFLQDKHIAVDLCAAPGGWMQILAQEMPQPRKIIGIDLDPIKPLGGDTTSFVGDITTLDCRRTLLSLLDGHQVDIFVHDGAPNFGTSKDLDMFVQNDLVLHALKLTTEFLKKDGVFVTKIFRSENFSKIINVLEQLFNRVDVTKPMSSRSESAEIFAVCRGFKDPDTINSDIFDSNILFKDETIYKEDYKKILLSEYIRSSVPNILDSVITIVPDFECELIDSEVLEIMKDLKLHTKNDLKKLKRIKEMILARVKKGVYKIPVLQDLFVEKKVIPKEESESVDKLEEIEDKLAKIARDEEKLENRIANAMSYPALSHNFFDDGIFKPFEVTEELPEVLEIENKQEIDEDTCSTSMDMTESEMRAAIMLKENEDEFIEGTIDKYLLDSDDIALPSEKRVLKINEPKSVPKKKIEYISRKKARAMRRANKVMSEIQIENEEEEAVVYKKVYKGQYKKQTKLPRLVFPSGGIYKVPSGKGKVKFLDSRMKHDLRIEKLRKKLKK